MATDLLVVEDDATPVEASAHAILARQPEYRVDRCSWERAAHHDVGGTALHGIVAVAVPHTIDVSAALERLRGKAPHAPTLVVLPPDPPEPLVRLSKHLADDFVLAPLRAPDVRHRLERLLGTVQDGFSEAREHLLQELGLSQLVGRDPAFMAAVRDVPRFARFGSPVLITGETGTGKELFARAIHLVGPRRDAPFIAVDCAALPDHLVENELFGHARGAYTDAHREHSGLIAMAAGGTLFLDEIDALSLAAQSKLLRFLQERTFRRLGSDQFETADVNVVAATNRDLETAVRDRQFRADLYYRLNVLRLHLPPLRARPTDIALLATHFLREADTNRIGTARLFSPAALHRLSGHDWPGNVRELANVVQRALAACDGSHILPCHLALGSPAGNADPASAAVPFHSARAAALAAFERGYVEELLRKHGGNVTHAAREAGKERRTFGRLIKRHGITRTSS